MRYHPVLLAILLAGCQQDTTAPVLTAPAPLPEVAGPIRAEQLPTPADREWINWITDLAVEPEGYETAKITWTQPDFGGWAELWMYYAEEGDFRRGDHDRARRRLRSDHSRRMLAG